MQHTRSIWVRGPGQDSTFWGVPDYFTRPGTLPLPFWGDCAACPPNDVQPTSVTVPARPPFSPNGIFARPMYGDPQFGFAGNSGKVFVYGLILVAGLAYLNSTRKKKPGVTAYRRILANPKKMKLGERVVRVGIGTVLTGAGAIGWFGPQAAEPVTTALGGMTSLGGLMLIASGLTSSEAAREMRRDLKGG